MCGAGSCCMELSSADSGRWRCRVVMSTFPLIVGAGAEQGPRLFGMPVEIPAEGRKEKLELAEALLGDALRRHAQHLRQSRGRLAVGLDVKLAAVPNAVGRLARVMLEHDDGLHRQ